MWTAPPRGSGCLTFRSMVLQDSRNWFADEGQLSKTICEQTAKDTKFDEQDCCACDEAKYNVIFEGLWSNETHPRDFPLSLWLTHFSDVIGASHVRNFSFWGENHIATDGFRSLAEWGSPRLLESELKAQSKYLKNIVKAPGLWYPNVNANTSATFRVDRIRHLVSLASMLGPSPDWVVGVNGLNLCLKNCSWMESLTVNLYPWDAGTDSGITYMSPNAETVPRERMYRITTLYPEDPRQPFYDTSKKEMPPLARFYFTREKIIPKSCDEQFLTSQIEVSEDSEDDTTKPECAVTEYTNWSACSVTCGKGLRMRSRNYRMPQKAAMFECKRQLVFKEMCVAEEPECDGQAETEDSNELLENNEGICKTTEWAPWSECSATCGIGFTMRTRRFIDRAGRKKCPHVIIVEKEKCMGPPCQAHEIEVQDPMCPVTDWSDWSPCSATCGKGVKLRTRFLLVDPSLQQKCSTRVEIVQQRPCTEKSDCTIDMATAKEICMQESEQGPCTGHFTRWYFEPNKQMCVPFVYGGCRGNRNNFLTSEECNEACRVVIGGNINAPSSFLPAPSAGEIIDCMVTPWTEWSPCSVTCGSGRSERIRMIKLEARNGGIPCPKRLDCKLIFIDSVLSV
ncbi:fat-spondin [Carabus blaptoides fortunei]